MRVCAEHFEQATTRALMEATARLRRFGEGPRHLKEAAGTAGAFNLLGLGLDACTFHAGGARA